MNYQPISCNLYDRIESLAVLKKNIKIIIMKDDKTEELVEGKITDIFSKEKSEFLVIDNSEIRLDKIKSISEA